MNNQRTYRAHRAIALLTTAGILSGSILFSRTYALASAPRPAVTSAAAASDASSQCLSLYDANWQLTGSAIGSVIYDFNGQAVYSYQDQHLYDLEGTMIANVDVNGAVTDLSGTLMGHILPSPSPE